MSYHTKRDIEPVRHLLLRLNLRADVDLAPSLHNRSLTHNLRDLWHLGMPKRDIPRLNQQEDNIPKRQKPEERGADYQNDTESDSEEESQTEQHEHAAPTEQLQALTVLPTPVVELAPLLPPPVVELDPRWYVTKQQNCMNSVMGYLKTETNVVLSPFSLMSCMAMMCRGASRDKDGALAYKQLAHYCWPTDDASNIYDNASHQALHAFVTQLQGKWVCNWKNIIVSDQLKPDYIKDITTHFEALEKKTSDWQNVNAEVSEVTHMKSDVLKDRPSGSVLINAIYFEDQWALPFDKEHIGMKFKSGDGTTQNVKMMTQKEIFRIAKHGDMTAVHMLYETPGMGAWFVKNSNQESGYTNDKSYKTLTDFLQQEFTSQTLTSSNQRLNIKIPQFNLEHSIDLKKVFRSVESHAITEIFHAKNLDRMTDDETEFFSIFQQDCILKVDRLGTKAAARTFAKMTRGGSGPTYYNVTFAHTFYMVIHLHDTILFVAKIGSPTGDGSGITPSTDNVPETKILEDGYIVKDGYVSSHFTKEEMDTQKALQAKLVDVTVNDIKRSMQIVTKQHDGKDDEEGELIKKENIKFSEEQSGGSDIPVRTYTVDPDLLIRVNIKFPTPKIISLEEKKTTEICVTPVYVKDTGEEEPEDERTLKFDEDYELPFPLQKEAGEEEDGWLLKDDNGKTFLKLRFTL